MIWVDSDFLSVSDIFIISEHISGFLSIQSKYWSSHWSWILTNTCGSYLISFFNIWNSITDIDTHPALGVSVLNHNTVGPSEISILRKWPWNLLITLLICSNRGREWKSSTTLFTIVVGLLDLVKGEILIPISNLSFVVILWPTL